MGILAPFLPYILGGLALVAAFFGTKYSAKREGKSEADAANAKRNAEELVASNQAALDRNRENVKGAHNAQNEVGRMSDDDVARELCDNWTRKD